MLNEKTPKVIPDTQPASGVPERKMYHMTPERFKNFLRYGAQAMYMPAEDDPKTEDKVVVVVKE